MFDKLISKNSLGPSEILKEKILLYFNIRDFFSMS